MENSFDVALTPENKKSIFQEILNAKTGMPYLITLSEDDRKSLPKMDDGCKQFVQKSFELASKNEALDPGSNLLQSGPLRYGSLCVPGNRRTPTPGIARDGCRYQTGSRLRGL